MRLALLVTSRCNASCTHCTTDSSPHRRQALGEDRIRALMDQAAALREPGEPLAFCISGGEPFLDVPLLARVIGHGAALGAEISCTTNGFWATTDDKADAALRPLAAAGLGVLGVSTSRFHQRFVPLQRVVRALTTARRLGLTTTLKCAVTRADTDDRWAERLARSCPTDQLEVFPVVPYIRDGERLPEEAYLREPGLPAGPCPGSVLTVRENGAAYTCCNPGGFAELLRVGDASVEPLGAIAEQHAMGGTQQILRRHGPEYFARYVLARGRGARLRPSYAGVCDLCAHIASDPQMARLARRASVEYERAQIEEVFARIMDRKRRRRRLPQGGNRPCKESI